MLKSATTPHGAGILLYGDYFDLSSLHETIHSLMKSPALPEPLKEFCLGLAYDLRKAFEGQREKTNLNAPNGRIVYQGARVLWLIILTQTALLRLAASCTPSTKQDQANLFRLEYCIEQALADFDAETAKAILRYWPTLQLLPSDFLLQFITETELDRLQRAKSGKACFKFLPQAIQRLWPNSPEYQAFEAEIVRAAKKLGSDPHGIEFKREEVDIRW